MLLRTIPLITTWITASWLLAGGLIVAAAGKVDYFQQVRPILAVHCYKCHDAENQEGGLRLDIPDLAFSPRSSGRIAIQKGSPGKSDLVRRVMSEDADERMPPKGARLSARELQVLQQWIQEGADWPARDEHWAFQRAKPVELPEGPEPNPIDRFINSKLRRHGIEHVAPTDDRTLLRRMFFGLIGMPPTPTEVEAFLEVREANRSEHWIAGLLGDSRYGERWARHWLDLVRYGESDGYEDDKVRPHAWRYRDYVIRALNSDKPYVRFVKEQIAGDELWPMEPDAWVATGFARLGAWDAMSKEPERQRQEFLNDATDAVGAAFMGVTLACARCHDHKYDPISQVDYFRVQAFFAGVKRASRELDFKGWDTVEVAQAFQHALAQGSKLRSQRDELLKRARLDLEAKVPDQSQPVAEGKAAKVSDDRVRKHADELEPGALQRLEKEMATWERQERLHAPRAEVVWADESEAPVTHLLKGGELSRPGPEVLPGFVESMLPPGISPDAQGIGKASRGRRTRLADWLASADHPLTARVMVNRVWQHHFGSGLVPTPSDFGRNGREPSHPELLDWLAQRFVEDGWSLKKLHLRIMTSQAYRRSSSHLQASYASDPANALLWRMNRRRADAEVIRDSFLSVSGVLNPQAGGPGVYAQLPKGINVEFPNNDKELSWGLGTQEDDRRRSVYLFQRRTLTFPLMDVFDAAPMNQSCAARSQTTVAPQALALFNGEFARASAARFAERLLQEAVGDLESRIERAFSIAFNRRPSRVEMENARRFFTEQGDRRDGDATLVLTDFCHVLLNASEMIQVD